MYHLFYKISVTEWDVHWYRLFPWHCKSAEVDCRLCVQHQSRIDTVSGLRQTLCRRQLAVDQAGEVDPANVCWQDPWTRCSPPLLALKTFAVEGFISFFYCCLLNDDKYGSLRGRSCVMSCDVCQAAIWYHVALQWATCWPSHILLWRLGVLFQVNILVAE